MRPEFVLKRLRVLTILLARGWWPGFALRHRKPMTWSRAMETLRDALLVADVTDHRDVLPAIT